MLVCWAASTLHCVFVQAQLIAAAGQPPIHQVHNKQRRAALYTCRQCNGATSRGLQAISFKAMDTKLEEAGIDPSPLIENPETCVSADRVPRYALGIVCMARDLCKLSHHAERMGLVSVMDMVGDGGCGTTPLRHMMV